MNRVHQEVIKHFNEKNHGQLVAKAANLTHVVAQGSRGKFEEIAKAMATSNTGAGAEWVEGGFSSDIIEKVSMKKVVAPAFERVLMPYNPYKKPVQGGPATAFITPENTADTGQASVKFSSPSTHEVIWNAQKLSAAVRTSDEFNADAIVDTVREVNRAILEGIALSEDEALINGHTAGSHMDSDVSASDDARKAFNGLRALTNAGAKVDLADSGLDGSMIKAVRAARLSMGKYGYRPSENVIITSLKGYYQLMNEGEVITLDKYGSNATILNGELGKFDGMPVLVSEAVRQDLNASGVFAPSSNQTILLIANTQSFGIGDRQSVELESAREAIYGQDVLIGRERIDFQKYFAASENPVSMVYNI